MLTPSLFNEHFDLFDHLYQEPWFGFNDSEFKNLEKKLYGHRANNVMNTDIKETDSAYEMTIDLPGFKKDEVSLALENGYLTITATKGIEQEYDADKEDAKKCSFIRKERYSGTCQRSFYVGDNLYTEDIKAKFNHGILTILLPKKELTKISSNKYISIDE